MTYEEFLDWADEDTLAEWVNGEVIVHLPASLAHQLVEGFLYRLIASHVEVYQLGAILESPFQMKLAKSGREPDLIFVANEHLNRLQGTYLDGPADLVIEIVSPESIGRDRGDKFVEYQQAGILEYWLLDPQMRRAEFYQLDAAGQYQLIPPDAEGIYRSRVLPGFWLRVGWLCQDPLPVVEGVLLEVGGEAYARRWIERLQRGGFWPAS